MFTFLISLLTSCSPNRNAGARLSNDSKPKPNPKEEWVKFRNEYKKYINFERPRMTDISRWNNEILENYNNQTRSQIYNWSPSISKLTKQEKTIFKTKYSDLYKKLYNEIDFKPSGLGWCNMIHERIYLRDLSVHVHKIWYHRCKSCYADIYSCESLEIKKENKRERISELYKEYQELRALQVFGELKNYEQELQKQIKNIEDE